MFIVTWYETTRREKFVSWASAACSIQPSCSVSSSGCCARQHVIHPSPYCTIRRHAASIRRCISSGGASPFSRGFETTQIGGGFWRGLSGPISVPE
jgi:hypothetical protein